MIPRRFPSGEFCCCKCQMPILLLFDIYWRYGNVAPHFFINFATLFQKANVNMVCSI